MRCKNRKSVIQWETREWRGVKAADSIEICPVPQVKQWRNSSRSLRMDAALDYHLSSSSLCFQFIPPMFSIRSCGLERSVLLIHVTCSLVAIIAFSLPSGRTHRRFTQPPFAECSNETVAEQSPLSNGMSASGRTLSIRLPVHRTVPQLFLWATQLVCVTRVYGAH